MHNVWDSYLLLLPVSVSHTNVKAFKPSAQLCATYSISRETSEKLESLNAKWVSLLLHLLDEQLDQWIATCTSNLLPCRQVKAESICK